MAKRKQPRRRNRAKTAERSPQTGRQDADGVPALGEAQQVQEMAQALLAEGRHEEALAFTVSALEAVLGRNRELELLVMKLQRRGVGKRSERVDPKQMALLLEEWLDQENAAGEQKELDAQALAREDAELDLEIKRAEQAGDGGKKGKGKRKRRKRDVETLDVERQVHTREVAPAERTCARCGREQQRIGEDVSRVLEYVPGHFVEHEYRLEKYACGTCKRGVTTAEAPAKVIERSAAGASLLADVVVSKYVDHCPLHRLHRRYERSGATVPVSTMSEWVGTVADQLRPLVDVLAQRVCEAYVVSTDATGLEVLDRESPANIERGTMWCYLGDDKDVVFRYAPSGEGQSGPWTFLENRRGYVQADAANVFDRLYNGMVAQAVEVGCWAHGRRRLVALQDTDCRVAYPLKLIARLYRLEHLADALEYSSEERTELRRERSRPVLEKLSRWLLTTLESEPPSSSLAQAARYIVNQWAALTRFVDDGRLSLDNNLCEQQIRDIALGRKNYLFAGSHDAAHHAAVLYSLTRTCAQHGVAPLPYLTDVLSKLADGWPTHRLAELLPDRWNAIFGPSHDTSLPPASPDTV